MPIELGTKNTLLDGALTLNGDVFYYNYKGYQISRNRGSHGDQHEFQCHGEGRGTRSELGTGARPEIQSSPAAMKTRRIDKGNQSIDLMDRTAGNPDWMVVKPFVTQASNCILADLCRCSAC